MKTYTIKKQIEVKYVVVELDQVGDSAGLKTVGYFDNKKEAETYKKLKEKFKQTL